MIQFISYWTGLSSCSSVQIARSWSKKKKKINSLEIYLNMKIAISYKSYTKPQRTFTRRTQWARFQFPKRMAILLKSWRSNLKTPNREKIIIWFMKMVQSTQMLCSKMFCPTVRCVVLQVFILDWLDLGGAAVKDNLPVQDTAERSDLMRMRKDLVFYPFMEL